MKPTKLGEEMKMGKENNGSSWCNKVIRFF